MTTPKIRANASTDGIDQMLRSCREKHDHGTDEPNADDLQPEIECPQRTKPMTTIARVFPRRTKATPVDALAFTGPPPGLFPPAVDEVHVSVVFSWDIPRAEWLAEQWQGIAPVTMGGPALGGRSEAFEPGRYLAPGYVITSRGCPNRCWFCDVWQREGSVRELAIVEGNNILDDNLLACSPKHIRAVFAMLRRQPGGVQFTGGLEAARLEQWHVDALRVIRPRQMFFAYDTPDDLEPLREAGKMMLATGWSIAGHQLRCYVLVGGPRDTLEAAESRLHETIDAGFLPMAMLWRNRKGATDPMWRKFQRRWARPAIIAKEIAR